MFLKRHNFQHITIRIRHNIDQYELIILIQTHCCISLRSKTSLVIVLSSSYSTFFIIECRKCTKG